MDVVEPEVTFIKKFDSTMEKQLNLESRRHKSPSDTPYQQQCSSLHIVINSVRDKPGNNNVKKAVKFVLRFVDTSLS
jgi:hypothetical protein